MTEFLWSHTAGIEFGEKWDLVELRDSWFSTIVGYTIDVVCRSNPATQQWLMAYSQMHFYTVMNFQMKILTVTAVTEKRRRKLKMKESSCRRHYSAMTNWSLGEQKLQCPVETLLGSFWQIAATFKVCMCRIDTGTICRPQNGGLLWNTAVSRFIFSLVPDCSRVTIVLSSQQTYMGARS